MSKYQDHNAFVDKKDQLSSLQSFIRFLYDRQNHTVLGRTASSWGKICVFYIVFYICLAAIFSISMWVFFQTLDPRTPTWRLDKSLIGTNPGLGFRPMPPDSNVESTLIWYRGTGQADYQYWKDSLVKFLEVYRKPGLTPGRGQNIANCNYKNPPAKGKVCDVDVRNWHPCTQENEFNFHKLGPCIFLKLNKIYGWTPEYYNSTNGLPANMPQELKNHIATVAATNPDELNTIWVSCEGENPADIENLGKVNYLPKHGFPGFFFPYENSEGYLSPPIAIHIERPRTGILINIECKAWAKNIVHNRAERLGSVHLELMID